MCQNLLFYPYCSFNMIVRKLMKIIIFVTIMIPIDQIDDILIVKFKSLSIIFLKKLLKFPLIIHGSSQISGPFLPRRFERHKIHPSSWSISN